MLKSFILVSLVSFAAQADLSQTACTTLLKETERLVSIAKDRFAVGEVNHADVASAELEHLEAQFDCRAILFADYCKKAVPTAQSLVQSLKELEQLGQAETADVVRAQKKEAVVLGLCR